MASATALWRSIALSSLASLSFLASSDRERAEIGVLDSVSGPGRKLRAVTTSLIIGRIDASSLRHIAATATAWLKLFAGNSSRRRGSTSSENLFESLNMGSAWL